MLRERRKNIERVAHEENPNSEQENPAVRQTTKKRQEKTLIG
jgi:hypothetical protein